MNDKRIEDMYNLIYKTGHNDPETTIKIILTFRSISSRYVEI